MSVENFGKWRKRFWPVHSFELKKVLPLIIMKFLISFVYGIFLSMKDTLIVTGEGSGAAVIPVLKGWIVLPVAIGVTLLYAKLANRYQRSTLFYGTINFFILFIFLFSFVLYPNKDILSPIQSSDWILASVGQKYSHWIAVYRNWIQTLFFVVAELWAPLVIFMLFWGLCNQINLVEGAKRYYTLFIVAGDLGTIFTGPLIVYYSRKFASLNYIFTIQALSGCLIAFGIGIIALHWWLLRYGLDKEDVQLEKVHLEKKPKLSLGEGLRYISSSRYLRCVAFMVIGYGLIINMVEVPWKASVHQLYSNPAQYQEFVVKINSIIGFVAMFTAFFLSGNVIRIFGWRFSAMISPLAVGATAIVFFILLLFYQYTGLTGLFVDPLVAIVYFGAFQNIISKTVKYSFFDPTKEMTFIPLDQESKVKGKAAIDVVGSRLGKSGSGWIQLVFMQILGTNVVTSIAGLLLPFVVFTMIYWIISVKQLHGEFQEKTEEQASVSTF